MVFGLRYPFELPRFTEVVAGMGGKRRHRAIRPIRVMEIHAVTLTHDDEPSELLPHEKSPEPGGA